MAPSGFYAVLFYCESCCPQPKGSKLMERSKTDNRSAFALAIKRRDDAMLGPDPVGHAEDEHLHKPRVGIWRIAGNRDRSRAGWADTVANSAQSRESHSLRRTPTAVSGVWLFLLSCLVRGNGLLALVRSRKKWPASIADKDVR
jgi:hypothetical protein